MSDRFISYRSVASSLRNFDTATELAKAFPIVSDGQADVTFSALREHTKINAIELVRN